MWLPHEVATESWKVQFNLQSIHLTGLVAIVTDLGENNRYINKWARTAMVMVHWRHSVENSAVINGYGCITHVECHREIQPMHHNNDVNAENRAGYRCYYWCRWKLGRESWRNEYIWMSHDSTVYEDVSVNSPTTGLWECLQVYWLQQKQVTSPI